MSTNPLLACVLATLLVLLLTINARAHQPNVGLPGQFLGPQNAARSSIRLPPLKWDPRLARYAQWYVQKRQNDCSLVHSGGPYGENIFWGSGLGWSPAQAVAAWVSERGWYRHGQNTCGSGGECGHYTQIVWRNTRRVGCAMVECGGGRGVFVVCNYDPPGNYVGERPY